MTAFFNASKEIAPMLQADPEFGPVAAEALQFNVRGFPAGRSLELKIEEYTDKLIERADYAERVRKQQEAMQEQQLRLQQQQLQMQQQAMMNPQPQPPQPPPPQPQPQGPQGIVG